MSDWDAVTLGDVLSLEYGKPLPEGARDGNGYPVFGSAGEVGRHSVAMVNGPGIIVGRKGTAGRVTWSADDFSAIDTTYWVRLVDPDALLMEFAYLMLQAADLPALTAQTGVPGLNRDRAYSQRVLRPALPTQRRIVDLVTAIDSQRAALDAEAAAATDLWSASAEREFNRTDVPRVPLLEALSDGGRLTDGDWIESKDQSPSGIPLLQLADIGRGSFLGRSSRFISRETFYRLRCTPIRDGDVLISRMAAPIGRTCAAPAEHDGSVAAVDVAIASPGLRMSREYLVSIMNSDSWLARCDALGTGSTRRRISRKNLGLLSIPVPPLDEQMSRAGDIELIRRMASCLEAQSRALHGLRLALLPALLSGEFEIPESYDDVMHELAEMAA